MNKKVFIALTVLVMAALACSTSAISPTATAVPPVVVPTAVPTTIIVPTTPPSTSGTVLFRDDFSDTNSGWDHSSTANGTADYQNGGYRINIVTTKLSKWANPLQYFQADVSIDVDVTKLAGPDDNAFGVMCRYQDTSNFYKFYLSSDGYAGIIKMLAGTSTVISSPDGLMQPVDGINQGQAFNHLHADCIGNTLTLFANGTQVATATDSDISSGGDVGLVAAAYDTAGTDVLFTNFVVSMP